MQSVAGMPLRIWRSRLISQHRIDHALVPMKLAYVTGASIPSTTAHASYAANLCNALSRAGVDTLLVAVKGPLDEAAFRRKFSALSIQTFGWPWLHRRPTIKLVLLAVALLAKGRRWEADRMFIAHNDIVAAALAMQRRDFLYDLHNFGPGGRILRYALGSSHCKGIIYSCLSLQSAFERRFQAAARLALVLGNAIDPAYITPRRSGAVVRAEARIPQNKKVIAYIGSMGAHRGIELMLQAAARQGRTDLFWLFVGGRADEIAEWRAMARDLNLSEETVRFTGFRPQEELGDWYAAADVLCAAYRRQLPGWGHLASMKLLEYQATGKPVIVSDMPFAREILSDRSAAFFDPDDPEGLSRALLQALEKQSSPQGPSDVPTWDSRAQTLAGWLRAHFAPVSS